MSLSPKVWSKFSAKKKDGTVLNLRIVDMPKYLSEEVVDLHRNHFVQDEKTYIATGVPASEKAMEELRGALLGGIRADVFHIVICCLDNNDEEIKDIFGASLMSLVTKNDTEPEFEFKTEAMKKLFQIFYDLEAQYNEMKEFDLDLCFSDRGLFVCPKYRGLGIAQEFFKVRRLICEEHGIRINGAWMTSYGTQKAAERDGWETVYEVQYDDMEEKYGVKFTGDPPSYKFMIARIQV